MRKSLLYLTTYDLSRTPFADNYLPFLSENDWEIEVLAPNADRSITHQLSQYSKKLTPLPNPARRFDFEWTIQSTIFKALIRQPTVLYVHSEPMAIRAAFQSPLLTRPARNPLKLVYHSPDYYDPRYFPWRSDLEAHLGRRADLYINNEYHRGYITHTYNRYTAPIITLPPYLTTGFPVPTPTEQMRKTVTGNMPDAVVGIVHGGFSPLRATAQVLQALKQLPRNYRLVMTSSGRHDQDASTVIDTLRLHDRVLRLPNVPYDTLLQYTVCCDYGVLLYSNSDLGNFFTAPGRLTEYLACGIPVLACDHTALAALVRTLGIGEVVRASDAKLIARGCERLASAVASGVYERRTIRDIFERRLSLDAYRNDFVAALNGLLGLCALPENRYIV